MVENALSSLAAKQAQLRAENDAKQAIVDGLLLEVSAMGRASPADREALMSRIAASGTASGGAVAEDCDYDSSPARTTKVAAAAAAAAAAGGDGDDAEEQTRTKRADGARYVRE